MGNFGKYGDQEMTGEKRKKMEESWRLFDGPGLSPFVCAMASLVLSGQYRQAVYARDWTAMILIPIGIWFGFFAFRAKETVLGAANTDGGYGEGKKQHCMIR